MKANELMIGDWVRKLEPGGHTIPVKVTGIIDEDNNVLFERRDGVHGVTDIKAFEPIPLTKEILEKNGFKQIGKKFIWGEIDDDLIEITPSINNSYRIKISVADLMTSCSMWCSYVHELQHALRLCGIEDDTIELWPFS